MAYYNPYSAGFNTQLGYGGMTGYPPPSFVQSQPPQPPVNTAPVDLIRVTGMEGARAYQMPPNSRAPLFDDTDDIVIFKTTDGAGFPSYRRARLAWIDDTQPAPPAQPAGDYVTRAEFEELKEIVENAKHPVRKPKPAEAE
jgi:hypothetical protein